MAGPRSLPARPQRVASTLAATLNDIPLNDKY
jgi:hypothetical protein